MSARREANAVRYLPAQVLRVTCTRRQARAVVDHEFAARGYRLAGSAVTGAGDDRLTFHWSSPVREAVDDVLGIGVLRSKLRGGPHGFGRVTVDVSGDAPATVVTVALRHGVFHAPTVREILERIIGVFAAAGTLADPGTPISALDVPPE